MCWFGGESLVLSLSVKTFCFWARLGRATVRQSGNPNSDAFAPSAPVFLARFPAFPLSSFFRSPVSVAACCRRCRSVSPAFHRRCSQVQVCVGVGVGVDVLCPWSFVLFGFVCVTSLSVVGLSVRLMLLAAEAEHQTPQMPYSHLVELLNSNWPPGLH